MFLSLAKSLLRRRRVLRRKDRAAALAQGYEACNLWPGAKNRRVVFSSMSMIIFVSWKFAGYSLASKMLLSWETVE